MNINRAGTQKSATAASGDPGKDDPTAWSSKEVLRLIIVPAVATLLFASGVYWLQLQLHGGTTSREANGIVQVRLLPRPDPVPIPVAPAAQTAMVGSLGPTDHLVDAPAETSEREMIEQPIQPTSAGPIATPNLSASPVANMPESPAIVEFRETLLRHIARYQKYPTGAERLRLRGTVRTVFSVGRNGQLLGVWVKTSSGEIILDQAAIETIRRAQPLPAIPAALPDPLKIEVALGFDPS
jgi:protein TonB